MLIQFRVEIIQNWASISVRAGLFLFFSFLLTFWLRWVFVVVHGLSLIKESWGLHFIGVHRLLIAVAALIVEHGL